MNRQTICLIAAIGSCSAVASRTAFAGDATLAEALFREGKALLQAGDLAQACPKLQESYSQDPATGTLLALALCYEQSGKLASAWTTYSEVAARAHRQGRADRERAARAGGAALEPILSKLTIHVPPDVASLPGLVVKRDGQAVTAAGWNVALPADGGEHVIDVTADGKKPWRRSVTLATKKDTQTVNVAELETAAPVSAASPVAVSAPSTQSSAPNAPPAEPSSAAQASPLRPMGLVAAGLGVVALGVGSVFGLKARSADTKSKADGHCDATGCDATGKGFRNDAFSNAHVSSAMFIVGGVLAVGGVTLYLVGGPRQAGAAAAVGLTPIAGGNSAALLLHGGF